MVSNSPGSGLSIADAGQGCRKKVESREKVRFVKYGKIAGTPLEKHIYADALGS